MDLDFLINEFIIVYVFNLYVLNACLFFINGVWLQGYENL